MSNAYHDAIRCARAALLNLANPNGCTKVGIFSADLNNRLVDLEVRTLYFVGMTYDKSLNHWGFKFDAGWDNADHRGTDVHRRICEVTKDEHDVYLLIDWRGGGAEPALEVNVGRVGDLTFDQVLVPPPPEVLARPLVTLTMIVPQKVATPVLHTNMLFEFGEADFEETHDEPLVCTANLAVLRARGVDV